MNEWNRQVGSLSWEAGQTPFCISGHGWGNRQAELVGQMGFYPRAPGYNDSSWWPSTEAATSQTSQTIRPFQQRDFPCRQRLLYMSWFGVCFPKLGDKTDTWYLPSSLVFWENYLFSPLQVSGKLSTPFIHFQIVPWRHHGIALPGLKGLE